MVPPLQDRRADIRVAPGRREVQERLALAVLLVQLAGLQPREDRAAHLEQRRERVYVTFRRRKADEATIALLWVNETLCLPVNMSKIRFLPPSILPE